MKKAPLNAAMLVYSHYSRDARVRRYAESLAEKGFLLDIVCLSEDYRPREKNIRLHFFPMERRRLFKFWYIIEYSLFFLYSFFTLTILSVKNKYKIVHVHNMPDFLVFAALTPKLFGAKLILDLHDPMPEVFISKYGSNGVNLLLKLIILSETFSFAFADRLITANGAFCRIFINRHPALTQKLTVIRNLPDEKLFHPAKKSRQVNRFTLMYMGTVEERYPLLSVLPAIKAIRKDIPGISLRIFPKITAEGDYLRKLKDAIDQSGLSGSVRILPPVPVESLAAEAAVADAGILVLKKDDFTDLIIPVKLLEFFRMGIPVIATRTENLALSFDQKTVLFLNHNSVREIAAAIKRLYRDKKLYNSLVANALSYLDKNRWQTDKKLYLNLIDSLVKG